MLPNIPNTDKKRIVIVGAGFAGLEIAQRLSKRSDVQIVLLDKNNYHQFQPLFYQVAMAGLEPGTMQILEPGEPLAWRDLTPQSCFVIPLPPRVD